MRPILVALALLFTLLSQCAAQPTRPHIIFVLSDDLGPGDVACWGGQIVPTPHIDQLAAEGTRFEQYYSASPVCSPSRCGLITGQFPARWQITSYLAERARNRGAEQVDFLDPHAQSLPRTLQQAGYRTAHFGKWHLGGGRDVDDAPKFANYGYDEHAGTYESPEPDPDITATNWIWSPKDKVKRWERTGFFVDKTLDFLRHNHGQPCFVNVWLDDVHTPWVPTATIQKVKERNIRENLESVMSEVDRQIGRLLAGLKEMGIDDQSLVIFTSDNGPYPHLADRTNELRGCKFSLYEGGVRLPLIARWPGSVKAGATDATTVLSAVDIFPTLCHIAGAELPPNVKWDGQDQSAALLGQPQPQHAQPIYWEYGRNEKFFGYPKGPGDRSPNLAIRDGQWKLLINADGSAAELYDLTADPSETKNVAADHADIASRLQQSVLDWRKSLPRVAN